MWRPVLWEAIRGVAMRRNTLHGILRSYAMPCTTQNYVLTKNAVAHRVSGDNTCLMTFDRTNLHHQGVFEM